MDKSVELRHLRYFVAVAEELNFRRAAERLNVSQPTLSAQIRQMEDILGVRLLERDTHRTRLTGAGATFLERARRILTETEDSCRLAAQIGAGRFQQLSIGFVASLGHGLLPGVLRAFRQQSPAVELKLSQLDTTQQIEALAAGRLDLGFIGLGLSAHTADLELATVAEEQLMAMLPKDHPLAHRRRLRLQELAGQRFILAARQGAPLYNPWLVVLCRQAGFQPDIHLETGQPITVLNYVAAGTGVTILPAQFARLPTVGVTAVPLAPPVPPYRYCAAWRPDNPHPGLHAFISIATAAYRAG